MQEMQVGSLGWEDPLEKEWQPTAVLLPGKLHGQRSLAGYSPWGHKKSDTTEWLTLFPLTWSGGHCLSSIPASFGQIYSVQQVWQSTVRKCMCHFPPTPLLLYNNSEIYLLPSCSWEVIQPLLSMDGVGGSVQCPLNLEILGSTSVVRRTLPKKQQTLLNSRSDSSKYAAHHWCWGVPQSIWALFSPSVKWTWSYWRFSVKHFHIHKPWFIN